MNCCFSLRKYAVYGTTDGTDIGYSISFALLLCQHEVYTLWKRGNVVVGGYIKHVLSSRKDSGNLFYYGDIVL